MDAAQKKSQMGVWKGLRHVFAKIGYLVIASIAAALAFAFAVWLPNLHLVASTLTRSDAPLMLRLQLPVTLLGSIVTNFSPFSATMIVTLSMLLGIDTALVAYHTKQRLAGNFTGGFAAGAGGIVAGVLGIGCAACGSIVAMSFLPLVGGAGILAALPLGGGEFGVLGIILLGSSIAILAKKATQPLICVEA
ncbi:MAG: hypothetical protein B7X03_03795 [Parcubacteria group bacterium 21-58-10]|nr:MAG: hypothetical protein B7X03_03795 [Parcubacteria group bacterium 21-58-10]